MKPQLIHLPEVQSEWLKSFEKEHKPLSVFLFDKTRSDLVKKRDAALKLKIKENLAKIDYIFDSEDEFEKFMKKRITLIQFDNFQRELYLDYKSKKQRGLLIASYSDEVSIDTSQIDNYKISMDIKLSIG